MPRLRTLPPGFDRLAAAESDFLRQQFLAPRLANQPVRVRLAGVVCTLRVEPAAFQGWGVFQPVTLAQARLVRLASLRERTAYLSLFPRVRFVLCRRTNDQWYGLLAGADSRFHLVAAGPVPLQLVDCRQLFDTVVCRFDGSQFWWEQPEPRRAKPAEQLREALAGLREPEALEVLGLTPVEQAVYEAHYRVRQAEIADSLRDRTEERLAAALEHAGATLQGYREREDAFTVEYLVDGERHTSVLRKDDLQVQAAGICLRGTDGRFDLQSLVGVIREAKDGHRLVRVGIDNPHQYHEDEDHGDEP